MRQRHFDAFRPQCPRCRVTGRDNPLRIASVEAGDEQFIWAGVLHCPAGDCQLEFPILDGVPIIVPDVRSYLASSASQLLRRRDLPASLFGLIGDATGPGSDLDQSRQQLSTYAWSHYGEFDPDEDEDPRNDGLLASFDAGLRFIDSNPPALDIGCSVGRTTFELAGRVHGPTLGVDLNFAKLQLAQSVLRSGRVSYERRRIGLVYDRREFDVNLTARDEVDFWACDAMALPFATNQFGIALAMNVLDCVSSPLGFLSELRRVLHTGAGAALSTPYDWSPAATPVEGWIGGHSQRGADRGDGPARLHALLGRMGGPGNGLEISGEITEMPWRVRVHSRSTVVYSNHVFAVRAA